MPIHKIPLFIKKNSTKQLNNQNPQIDSYKREK